MSADTTTDAARAPATIEEVAAAAGVSRSTVSRVVNGHPPNGGAVHPEFTDPGTWVGADSNPTLDANDEIALMAFDAGGPRTTPNAPAGVDAGSAVEMEITDPIDGGVGYAYLFEDTSGLDPAAGKDYVDYEFNLSNGPYKTGPTTPRTPRLATG